jgi:simple sugar transport system permease protein
VKHLLRITKRAELPKVKGLFIQVVAILLSLVFAGIVIFAMGFNPIRVFTEIINGSVGTQMRLNQTILRAIPLVITSMGILVAFKMKFWNIGGEGQIMMGAMGATFVAINSSTDMSNGITLLLMAMAAILCGGFWAFIPAYFKGKFGTNEVIFTLMMNYIAILWVTFLQFDLWRAEGYMGFPRIAMFAENAVLPRLFGIHVGWVIAIAAVIFVYIFINHTKRGYEISVLGESMETARYAGMNTKAIMIVAMLISGGLCGLTGMVQVSGVERTLTYATSAGIGFTAIITTWLGRLSAPVIVIVCFIFAMLLQGGTFLQLAIQVPAAVAQMLQGTILFFVLGSEFFTQYKVSLSRNVKKEVA